MLFMLHIQSSTHEQWTIISHETVTRHKAVQFATVQMHSHVY